MLNRKQKYFFLKLFSLFSIIRGYNVLIIVLAQYVTSIYILAPYLSVKEILFDVNLFMIDGITAIIEQQSTVKVTTWISGATGGGIGAGIAALIFYTGRFHHWW